MKVQFGVEGHILGTLFCAQFPLIGKGVWVYDHIKFKFGSVVQFRAPTG